MASLTLKDIPEELLENLRAAAKRDRRSLSQEALVILEGGLARRESNREQAMRQLEAWRALAGKWVSDQTVEEEVASILGARTVGRDIDL